MKNELLKREKDNNIYRTFVEITHIKRENDVIKLSVT